MADTGRIGAPDGQGAPGADVVVVGLGVVSPAGQSCEEHWRGRLKATSFAQRLDRTVPGLPLAGHVVPDGAWLSSVSHAEQRRLDRIALLGLAAAQQAVDGAGLDLAGVPADRRGFVAGIGFGGITTLHQQLDVLGAQGWRKLSPFGVPAVMPSSLAAFAAIRFGVQGPAMTVTSACASGTHAVVEAARLIRDGSADVVLAGGAEAPLDGLPMASFARMAALGCQDGDPTRASRPFDRARSGFVLGEGAAFLLLASADVARAAGAAPRARVAGWSVTTDAHHVAAPDPQGLGMERCMRGALARAGIEPAAVAHVNAHGTGTPVNDAVEASALARVFGAGAVPVTSAKGAIGHLMGGAGAVEAVETVLSLEQRLVAPTVNCDDLDPACDVDVVVGGPRPVAGGPALTSSFAFGGQNACLVLDLVA